MLYGRYNYNEEEAMRNAIQESIENQQMQEILPPGYGQPVETPVDAKVNRLLYAIDRTKAKIDQLMKYDITKTMKATSSPKKKTPPPPLSSSAQIRNEQDRKYRLAELEALRRQEEEEEEANEQYEDDNLHSPTAHTEGEENQEQGEPSVIEEPVSQIPSQNDSIIIMKVQINCQKLTFTYPSSTKGEVVYQAVFDHMQPTSNSMTFDSLQILDPIGKLLERNKTLAEQNIRNKTLFFVR
ncbi:hypothetical protein TVAG_152280 [Trichomonas vaginalis G3]|uniref:Uncharacterized protein n=1 Tax=Trichomonas vaginalis (strain ATCC PRA-98 / G3) TaxID=412133 RepID=A2F704_TRIV3|nr:hypothetical protein TVAG_152280 [Trichomonas vaginalis G3]|eukprot:XP_001312239.1 hypothetical protein [Trichomonas vaginalis G3]